MTREQQIITEAKKHYYYNINCHNAFLYGVEWADEHPVDVWHDASEEPKNKFSQILYQDKHDDCWLTTKSEAEIYEWDWEHLAAACQIVRWAYISDLLPKGGEL